MAESSVPKASMYGQVAEMFRTVSASCASRTAVVSNKPILLMGGTRIAGA